MLRWLVRMTTNDAADVPCTFFEAQPWELSDPAPITPASWLSRTAWASV